MPRADTPATASPAPGDVTSREVTFVIIGTGFSGLGAAIALCMMIIVMTMLFLTEKMEKRLKLS